MQKETDLSFEMFGINSITLQHLKACKVKSVIFHRYFPNVEASLSINVLLYYPPCTEV